MSTTYDTRSGWPRPVPPPATMPAVVFREFGPADVLHVEEVPTPVPGPDEVLVQVAAVAVGRYLDVVARAGRHPYPSYRFPHILGAEHAGVVAATGEQVTGWAVGQPVGVIPNISCGSCVHCLRGYDELCPDLQLLGMHRPGAYAAYVAVPAGNLHEVPDGVSPEQATALALAGAVVLNQLDRTGFAPGQWVLVQGASGALGSLTARLVQHLGGHAIAMSRHEAKRAQLAGLGLDAVLDPSAADVVASVLDLTGGRGVEIVVDNLGEPALWATSMAVLAAGGHLVSSGAFLGGELPVDLHKLYLRGQHLLGVRTGNAASARALWAQVAAGFRPPPGTTFPLFEAAEAHRFVEQDRNVGRVSLLTDPGDQPTSRDAEQPTGQLANQPT